MTDLDNIPAALREHPQWVLHRNKVPFCVDGRPAKANDPATWSSFDAVIERYNAGGFDGIGYEFSADDGFCGIDLDGCRNAETGELAAWAKELIDALNTYAEVSPSGTGVKLWVQGKSPLSSGKKKLLPDAPRVCDKAPAIELYDHARFFCVTGDRLDGPTEPQEQQTQLDILAKVHFREPSTNGTTLAIQPTTGIAERARKYLAKIPPAVSGQSGHDATFHAACVLVLGFNLGGDDAFALLAEWNQGCVPPWNERELRHKIDSAMKQPGERGQMLVSDERFVMPARMDSGQLAPVASSEGPAEEPQPQPLSLTSLVAQYPRLHEPVIEGLLRRQETMNIIAPSKAGKSWLTYGLAYSFMSGSLWLDRFLCRRGKVLLIDNELHQPTLANRLRTVAERVGISLGECGDRLSILSLRGRLANLYTIAETLGTYEPGAFDVVILDAFYRAMPAGASENDNATIAGLYNIIDAAAQRLGCAWVNIHHSSKGSQSEKTVVDVGAGAGSQSRAADAHLVLRQHEEEGAVVLEAVVRSFAPVDPLTLRWAFPLWTPDDSLDPAQLRGRLTKNEERQLDRDSEGTAKILTFLQEGAKTTRAIRGHLAVSKERADRLLAKLQTDKQIGCEEFVGNGGKTKRYYLINKGGRQGGTTDHLLDHQSTT